MIGQHTLKPNPGSRRKSIAFGRGDSSGHGSFSGHGGKGQTARSGGGRKPGFEGGQTPIVRRMPKLKGFTPPSYIIYQPVNVHQLNVFKDGDTVDLVALYDRKIIKKKNSPVKVLANGELTKKLTVNIDACSVEAKKKIETAGGTVKILNLQKKDKPE